MKIKDWLKQRNKKRRERWQYERDFEVTNWQNYFKRHIHDLILIFLFVALLSFYAGQVKMCDDMGGFIPADKNSWVIFLTCERLPNSTSPFYNSDPLDLNYSFIQNLTSNDG